jgi:hypothetical protein
MTTNTSSDPNVDMFGPLISPETVRSSSERKGTAKNPHNETYPEDDGDGGLAVGDGGLERRWYIVLRGREVGKLYRSW